MAQVPGPKPSIDFPKQLATGVMPPLVATISGEITTDRRGQPLGVARYSGRITAVNFAVLGSGKNNTQVPTATVNVKINGVTCLTTQPVIAHVSGETAQQKTTFSSAGDTGITAAVIDKTANSFSAGDVFTWDLVYTGSTSPTTKMHNASLIVEVEPA